MSRVLALIPEALLGVAPGMVVHGAAICLPVCAVSFASPLLLLGAAVVILAPAAFLRGPWPKATAFAVSYAVALVASGLPRMFEPWGA
ncbi:MAG: hypothetical protein ACYTHK_16960 [Planctomycetota bacterium]